MNERIKELAEQAEKLADEHTKAFTDGTGEWKRSWNEVYDEKFAKLIVKECAELIDNKVTITAAQTYDEVFVAKYDTKELCANQIREHFGVDE